MTGAACNIVVKVVADDGVITCTSGGAGVAAIVACDVVGGFVAVGMQSMAVVAVVVASVIVYGVKNLDDVATGCAGDGDVVVAGATVCKCCA